MAGFLHADQDQFWKKLKSETKCSSKLQSESSSFLVWKIIQLSPEGDVNIDRDAKRRGRYLALFTDPEGGSCFSIYQISWIKLKKSNVWKSKTSLSRNFVYNVQTFRGFFSTASLRFCRKFSMKIIFYLPVNTDKPKVVTFLVFVCTTASFITQTSSFENVSERDAILASVAKQWIAKDIPSYGSQTNERKVLFTDLVNTNG